MNETLEQYIISLQDQGFTDEEIVVKAKEWKELNQPKEVKVEVLEEVDLGSVKTKDGVPGADAPSMGPQQPAPKEDTELTLEDTFSVSPEVETKVEEVKNEEDED